VKYANQIYHIKYAIDVKCVVDEKRSKYYLVVHIAAKVCLDRCARERERRRGRWVGKVL
jgi:hypothetical protein